MCVLQATICLTWSQWARPSPASRSLRTQSRAQRWHGSSSGCSSSWVWDSLVFPFKSVAAAALRLWEVVWRFLALYATAVDRRTVTVSAGSAINNFFTPVQQDTQTCVDWYACVSSWCWGKFFLIYLMRWFWINTERYLVVGWNVWESYIWTVVRSECNGYWFLDLFGASWVHTGRNNVNWASSFSGTVINLNNTFQCPLLFVAII